MEKSKVDQILQALAKLDNDEYEAVAKEVNKGLLERGIVKPKTQVGRRMPFRY